MSFVWITEKNKLDQERQDKELAKSIAGFINKVILRKK